MFSNTIPMTAQIPSGFAMPISAATYGTGLGAATDAGIRTALTSADARDRLVTGVAVAQGAVPGPTAWSPPTC